MAGVGIPDYSVLLLDVCTSVAARTITDGGTCIDYASMAPVIEGTSVGSISDCLNSIGTNHIPQEYYTRYTINQEAHGFLRSNESCRALLAVIGEIEQTRANQANTYVIYNDWYTIYHEEMKKMI